MKNFINKWQNLIKPSKIVPLEQCNLTDFITPIPKRLEIKYHKNLNILFIKGRSNVLDVSPVYLKLIEDVKTHFKSSDKLTIYFNYYIINATTIKLLFNLFKVLQDAHRSHKKVVVYWSVEGRNEVVIDVGYHFWEKIEFKFNIRNSSRKLVEN